MINLVEAGESTGNLVPVLENLIAHLEESADLKKKVYGGLAYPIFICTLAFGVLLLFLYFLLPRIEVMMKGMGSDMPFLTTLLINTANFAVHWGIFIVIGAIMVGAGVASWRRTPPGRAATDSFLLRLPVLKYIFSNIDICRVSNLCATLLESGLNTTETLRMTERSIGNVVFQSRFSAARSLINDGASFSNAFKRFQVLPDLDLDLLSVGENTGNVSKSFREIYKSHSRQLSEQFHLLTIMITGGALGLAFSLVTILALGIVSAVMNMAKAISSH
jgi:type II secretory pathway component PulF